MTRHLTAVPPAPDWTPTPGTWMLDLGHHDGTPCPQCNTTIGIPFATGIHNGDGRLCTTCTAADNPVAADMVEAIDALDTALAYSAVGQPRLVMSTLIAQGVAHVIDDRSAEEEP